MNKKTKKEVTKWKKLQDIFRTTKHQERQAKRLYWKDKNLDAEK